MQKKRLLACLRLGRIAILLSQFFKALTLAGVLALAGVIRAFARGLTLTRIGAIAMHLRFIGSSGADRDDAKEKRGGCGNRGSGDGLGRLHKNSSKWLRSRMSGCKVSHLTQKETRGA
jgi:hypothetical protein